MKTLEQIIEEVQSNGRPDSEDLRYALLALHIVCNDLARNYTEVLCGRWGPEKIAFKQNEKLLYGKALSLPPKEFLGWNNDPENPEYQRFHAIGKKLVEKALRGELPTKRPDSEGGKDCNP